MNIVFICFIVSFCGSCCCLLLRLEDIEVNIWRFVFKLVVVDIIVVIFDWVIDWVSCKVLDGLLSGIIVKVLLFWMDCIKIILKERKYC